MWVQAREAGLSLFRSTFWNNNSLFHFVSFLQVEQLYGEQAEQLAAHICFLYLPPLSLSPQKMPPWAARWSGFSRTPVEKFSISPTTLGLCSCCSKAGEMGSRGKNEQKGRPHSGVEMNFGKGDWVQDLLVLFYLVPQRIVLFVLVVKLNELVQEAA